LRFTVSGPSRLVALGIMCGMAASAIGVLFMDKPWGNRLGAAGFASAGVAFAYLVGIYPRLDLDLVRNVGKLRSPIGSREFALLDVAEANGGAMLRLRFVNGDMVRVFAVTNANLTLMMKRRGRTEEVADLINAHLRRQRHHAGA
jgi:hypothetical protein